MSFAQMGHDWVFYIMASDLPKYMKEVLGFSVHDVGLYSSLPYLLMFSISVSSGFLSDFLINHNFITITQARKTFTASGKLHLIELWSITIIHAVIYYCI